ncbi:MAG: hypothetical protein RBG1_1C00001G1397 [candidate division Zixibacteria bacterium RBG-1]|nr:MAG: hypothetical protein RBG1_1C00001G1397 [candidate division Zixibacteria bacterium RBG-1]OGC85555.1 MAG: hypothetical protein A2V73_06335 [candidate division Zixibacteria bacterium RBG_19FT_COMBO_42_43]
MKKLLGQIQTELSEKEEQVSPDLISLINARIKPPVPVTAEEIFIRAMYLISDKVNSYGGCFPQEEHPHLAKLIIDAPVLIGHNKEKLPVARNFNAELVYRDNAPWIKVWFYWLKNSEGGNSLKENIDHGIYKEGSIGFSFEFPECSVCGQDIRKCEHIPFRSYLDQSGQEKQAHFNYRKTLKILETSLVYRGAIPGTSFSRDLGFYQKSLSEIDEDKNLLVEVLGEYQRQIVNGKKEKVDLKKLALDLGKVRQGLEKSLELQKISEEILAEYKNEIKKIAKAISSLKQDRSYLNFTERLLNSKILSFKDLLGLKKQVKQEFDSVFQFERRSKIILTDFPVDKKVNDFKTSPSATLGMM